MSEPCFGYSAESVGDIPAKPYKVNSRHPLIKLLRRYEREVSLQVAEERTKRAAKAELKT